MTKTELINKYISIWNESKEECQKARRLKRQATDDAQRDIHELDQDYYAIQNRLVGQFLMDLEELN